MGFQSEKVFILNRKTGRIRLTAVSADFAEWPLIEPEINAKG